jgi:hypothetical protein
VAVALIATLLAAPPADAGNSPKRPAISVLSGRADLVSVDNALVAVDLRRPADVRRVKLTVKPKDAKRRVITRAFERTRKRRLVGLVKRLGVRRNVIKATLPDGSGAKLALINHPPGRPGLLRAAASALGLPADGRGRAVQPAS